LEFIHFFGPCTCSIILAECKVSNKVLRILCSKCPNLKRLSLLHCLYVAEEERYDDLLMLNNLRIFHCRDYSENDGQVFERVSRNITKSGTRLEEVSVPSQNYFSYGEKRREIGKTQVELLPVHWMIREEIVGKQLSILQGITYHDLNSQWHTLLL
jgi:hypothetical protein